MRIKKQKTEKWVAKTIKCIYSEPVILILLSARFDFGLINLFQTVLDQRTTISSPPSQEGVMKLLSSRFF